MSVLTARIRACVKSADFSSTTQVESSSSGSCERARGGQCGSGQRRSRRGTYLVRRSPARESLERKRRNLLALVLVRITSMSSEPTESSEVRDGVGVRRIGESVGEELHDRGSASEQRRIEDERTSTTSSALPGRAVSSAMMVAANLAWFGVPVFAKCFARSESFLLAPASAHPSHGPRKERAAKRRTCPERSRNPP